MPGLLPHLLAGTILYFVGRYVFKSFFDGEQKRNERILLLFVCLFFSIIPDVFLGLYYVAGLSTKETLMPYHVSFHFIITPLALLIFLVLSLFVDRKRTPTWFMGIVAIVVHIIMDQFIEEFHVLL
jgi:hypothetical protein